jgi:apolipoprotein N-acyltransferase
MIRKKDIILSLLSGILLVFSFPPFDFYPLAWIALIPLLISMWDKNIRASFFIGMLTGFVYFAGTTYWVFNSVYFYGNIPAVFSLLLVAALNLYLAAYVGIFSLFFNFLSRRSQLPALFIVPVLWVTLEFLRTYALTGFPWSILGYSQYKLLQIIQVADITGVYGISFLIASMNGAIFDVVAFWPKRLSRMPLYDRWPVTLGLVFFSLSFIFSIAYGVWSLKKVEDGERIRVSVIQGNFEQEKKWDNNYQREIIDTYKKLTLDASSDDPFLVVWPESAVPFIFGKEESLTHEIIDFQKGLNSYLIFGDMEVRDLDNGATGLSNSVLLMSPEGEKVATYDKIHLVPFGEYIPLRRLFPFIGKMVVAVGDFVAGREYTVMDVQKAKISSPICFEIIFPGLVRKFVYNGANLIVTVTNDAWFGRSSAPYQHFSMAVFRAVENRVPVVRAANTGVSGFIDAKGRIKKRSDIFVKSVLTEDISLRGSQKSFYSKYGDLFAFFCIISCVLLLANNTYQKKQ